MTLRRKAFRDLHDSAHLVLPNAWDVGSARILEHLGFAAIATTSSGAAAARGRRDGDLGRALTLASAVELADAVGIPVSADLENGFADDPDGVADTVAEARGSSLAGVSVEDWSGTAIYPRELAAERVRAATEAAGDLVLTARAENHIHGIDDLADTISRLTAFEEAGADVLYAPGLRTAEQVRAVTASVTRPLNVLLLPGMPPLDELVNAGARRFSVGGAFAFGAYGSLVAAAERLRADGVVAGDLGDLGSAAAEAAFTRPELEDHP